MNKYEIMLMLKPDLEEETRTKVIEGFKKVLTKGEGTVDNVNEWPLRELAYEVKKYTKAYYVVVDTTTTPANVAEFDRLSRINQNVLRHLTIKR